jgi:hypothetical protein
LVELLSASEATKAGGGVSSAVARDRLSARAEAVRRLISRQVELDQRRG